MRKSDKHIFTGMQRDASISKQKSEFLWEAKNIRVTAREGNTLLSVTNEKGNIGVVTLTPGDFTVLGYAAITKYLVLFCKCVNSNTPDYIIRIDMTAENNQQTNLFNGDLGFNLNNPIETQVAYESEYVQKVYWTDGENPPRVINITKDLLLGTTPTYTRDSFDFIQKLTLGETVTITRSDAGSGNFPAGVIQYAFSYYKKYGQESNIFYTSRIHAISHSKRGGSPEDKVSNSFSITISGVENQTFDYIRVYSILRTSLNATPVVKIVRDIKITGTTMNIVDDGSYGETIDPTRLLYVGGEDIRAKTFTQKDGTLFLGNLTIKRKGLDSAILQDYKGDNTFTDSLQSHSVSPAIISAPYYSLYNSIDVPPFFKSGEHYRFGVQFQHESGRWSEPVWIGDHTISQFVRPSLSSGTLSTIKVTAYIRGVDAADLGWLRDNGYKKMRGVVVLPSMSDRLVLTQGALCPTVFQVRDRNSNAPHAQASWFSRPFLNEEFDRSTYNTSNIDKGAFVEFRHLHSLLGANTRGGEIQNAPGTSTYASFNAINGVRCPVDGNKLFFVDQSVLTMHSPDIEFDESLVDSYYNNWKLRLVGLINITGSASDIDLQTSSPTLGGNGFVRKAPQIPYNDVLAGRSLVAGPVFGDVAIENSDYDKTAQRYYYMVYPWQRSGSINNDVARTEGTRSAVLSKKKISNLKFSSFNTWLASPFTGVSDISPISFIKSDQLSLERINTGRGLSYYGNVDTLIEGNSLHYCATEPNGSISYISEFTDDIEDDYTYSKEPVRMKYKSTPHFAFALNQDSSSMKILPSVNNLNRVGSTITKPFWIEGTIDTGANDELETIQGYEIKKRVEYSSEVSGLATVEGSRMRFADGIGLGVLVIGKDDDSPTHYRLWRLNLIRYGTETVDPITGEPVGGSSYYWEAVIPTTKISFNSSVFGNGFSGGTDSDATYGNNAIFVYYGANGEVTYYKWTSGLSDSSNRTNYYDVYTPPEGTSIEVPSGSYSVIQGNVSATTVSYPYLFLGELYRNAADVVNAFGGSGTNEEVLKTNLWLPASEPVDIPTNVNENSITFEYGDTWYQRYDCLKTYPFTNEDENSIIEILSFMCESRVNADGRYDRNRGQSSNLSMSPVNFNLYNPVYSHIANYFNYRILDRDYYKNQSYPTHVTYSLEKGAMEEVDPWTNITLANILSMDGDKGSVNALRTFNNELYCFQDTGIANILFNSRVQIPVSDAVPIEIGNSYKVQGKRYITDKIGVLNRWSIIGTPRGFYFVSNPGNNLYLFNGQLNNISDSTGMSTWFKAHPNNKEWTPDYSNGLRAFYDGSYQDVYFVVNEEALGYSEKLNSFISLYDYGRIGAMFNINDNLYSFKDDKIWEHFAGDYNSFYGEYKSFYIHFISNPESDSDKVFTNLDLRADFYADVPTLVEGSESQYEVTSDNRDVLQHFTLFDYIHTWNEYQDSGEVALTYRNAKPSNLKKKFRIWRMDIPRDKTNKLDRMRNTWLNIKLGVKNENSLKNNARMVLHDLDVQYFS